MHSSDELEQADELGQALMQLAERCLQKNIVVSVAESCTGGLIAAAITDVVGSSTWFDAGFVTYSEDAKQQMLNVKAATLAQFGVVSEPVVKEMAIGAVNNSLAHYAVSTSGVAGPGGGSQTTPVGTVCFGLSNGTKHCSSTRHFTGDRSKVRHQATLFALKQLHEFIL